MFGMRVHHLTERRLEPRRSIRLSVAKDRLARKLCRLCGHMDPAEFDRLIERMAVTEIKYAMRSDVALFDAAMGMVRQ